MKHRADLKGLCDNTWTVATWSWHSIHSFSTKSPAKKGHGFTEASYILKLSAKSPSLWTRKSYTDVLQESRVTHVTPRNRTMPGSHYSSFLYKVINNHLKPTNPSNTLTPTKFMKMMENMRWKNTNSCCSLSTYLPDNTLGNFEPICSLDTVNKLYKERDNKWFSWDFIITGFDPTAHAL